MTKPKSPDTYAPITAKRRDTTPKRVVSRDKTRSVAAVRARGFSTGSAAGAALISPDKPLTEKQRLFVQNWAKGESILSASARAGFADSGTVAYRLVRMPNVLRLYNAEKARYEAVSDMSKKKVMDGFLEAIEMAKLMAEPATMVAGWREIAKMCGYMAPVQAHVKVDITGNLVMSRMNQLSDAELLKLISGPQEVDAPIQANHDRV